jgi:hypothetical protein
MVLNEVENVQTMGKRARNRATPSAQYTKVVPTQNLIF